jgi:Na+/alanine symporter
MNKTLSNLENNKKMFIFGVTVVVHLIGINVYIFYKSTFLAFQHLVQNVKKIIGSMQSRAKLKFYKNFYLFPNYPNKKYD